MNIVLSKTKINSPYIVLHNGNLKVSYDSNGNLHFLNVGIVSDEEGNLTFLGIEEFYNDDGNLYLNIRRKKMANRFLAGVGKALLFDDGNLIGVAKTLTESTFNFSISSEDIRGGQANALFGKYFHDSNLSVNLVDAMFNLEYVAANLGVDIEMGGLSLYESAASGETVGAGGVITLSNTAVAFDGSVVAWYKKPTDSNWTITTVSSNNTITIAGASSSDVYCVKYFYQNADARQLTIKTNYVPKVLHLVVLSDLFSGDSSDVGSATKYGRIITDIPSFQLDGNMDLNLTATSAATISLMGNAIGVDSGDSCEEDPYYGTMTEEIFGSSWKDNVVALAVENSSVAVGDTLLVRAVYGGSIASNRIDNSNLTFAAESGTVVVSDAGVVSSGNDGAVISITLTGYSDIVAYATVEA